MRRRLGAIALALLSAAAVVSLPASAAALPLSDAPRPSTSRSLLSVRGATSAERLMVVASWDQMLTAFPGLGDCIGPLVVRVVDRAEDWYGGPVTASIAAFYRFPPASIVFVERGKVDLDNLTHEMAHHLDATCGLGEGAFGDGFLRAQGFAPSHSWTTGSGWAGVPAEHFAEAVVDHLDVAEPDIAISAAASELVAALADRPLLGA